MIIANRLRSIEVSSHDPPASPLDERQVRILQRMLGALTLASKGAISWERLAIDLEAHFSAGEFRDAGFRRRFLDLWISLEEAWDTKRGDAHEPLMKATAAELEDLLRAALDASP